MDKQACSCIDKSGYEEKGWFDANDYMVILDNETGESMKVPLYKLGSGLYDYIYIDGSRVYSYNLNTRDLRFEEDSYFSWSDFLIVNRQEYHYYNDYQDYWIEEKTVKVPLYYLGSHISSGIVGQYIQLSAGYNEGMQGEYIVLATGDYCGMVTMPIRGEDGLLNHIGSWIEEATGSVYASGMVVTIHDGAGIRQVPFEGFMQHFSHASGALSGANTVLVGYYGGDYARRMTITEFVSLLKNYW